jgi:hypothetical protein
LNETEIMSLLGSFSREEESTIVDDGSGDNDNDSESTSTSSVHATLLYALGYDTFANPAQQHQQQQQHQEIAPLSPQNSIDEEDFRRQLEHQRWIRRRRLIIRPAVILVLGLIVFRNNYHRRLFRSSFGNRGRTTTESGLRLQSQSIGEQEQHQSSSSSSRAEFSSKTVVGMQFASTDSSPNESAGGDASVFRKSSNHQHLAGSILSSVLGRGNPTASMYNIVTDMNDDDSNNDYPATANRAATLHNRSGTVDSSGSDNNSNSNNNQHGDGNAKDNNDSGSGTGMDDNNNSSANPATYGWVPEVYPDPWIDPVRCGIAYLLQQQPDGLRTGAAAEEERRGGLVVADNNNTDSSNDTNNSEEATNEPSQNAPPGLRLCDPDWVLGGAYLEKIAQKMKEFSNRFTPGDLGPIDEGGQPEVPSPDDDQQQQQGGDHPDHHKRQGLALAVATVRKVGVRWLLEY